MERKRTNTEKLVITAILIALEIILTRFVGISTPMLRISFGFLPMVIVAMYYGPIWGGGAYALADVLGSLIFPTGAYFPGFTVSACLTGIIYGLFLHKRKVTVGTGLAAVIAGAAVADISPTAERRREHGYFQRYAAGQRF